MKYSLLIFLLFINVEAKEKDSFITETEYAKHLYKNPRGIGCNKCHGKKGEGMIISKYKHKGEEYILQTKEINSLKYSSFVEALKEKRSIMPKYFLTNTEMKALYNYLHKEEK
ncbi:cytochrome c [Sulfurimonas sp. MAG313]|nr:c-type cytochrome [Sulfurimonas sp. MAG313]MDF1881142.1 cytochrome c [Sulfurimonas sp. MAG313]